MFARVNRRSFLKSVAVSSAFLIANRASALSIDADEPYTWTPVTIIGGGFVTGLIVHPRVPGLVYARTDVGGVYRWNEGTGRWTQLLSAAHVPAPVKSDYNVASMAIAPSNDQVLYIAAGDLGQFDNVGPGRVLKSINRGRTWTDSGIRWQIRGNGTYRVGSERLAVDPANENVVYFGSEEAGLWLSSDAGTSWEQISTSQVPTGTPAGVGAGVRFVLFDPSRGRIDHRTKTIYVGVSGFGVYVSRDAGNSWSLDLSSDLIPCDAKIARDGTLYVSSWTGGELYRRGPDSQTWSSVAPGTTTGRYFLGVDPDNSQIILAADTAVRVGHFFRSEDGGNTWDSLSYSAVPTDWLANTTQESWMSVGTFVFDPHVAGQVWFPEGFGVWRTADITGSEVTWTYISDGIEEMVTMDAIAPPGGVLISAVADWNGFRHDNLNKPPVRPILTSSASAGVSLNYSGGNPQFIAAISSDTNHVNPDMSGYSADGGETWTFFAGSRNYSDLYGGNIAVSATDTSNLVWLPTLQRSPYVSTDMGSTWKILSYFNGITGLHESIWYGFKRALDADKVNGQYFYIYSTEGAGAFYRSSDGGQTWVQAPTAPPSAGGGTAGAFNQIHAAPGHAGHVWASTQKGLFYTTDYGNTWTAASGVQSADAFGFGKAIKDYPALFLSGTINGTKGIWKSIDRGATWRLLTKYPLGYYTVVDVVTGDMNIAGRVYIGFSGNSFIYGDSHC